MTEHSRDVLLLFQCREKKQKILDIRKNVKDAIVVRFFFADLKLFIFSD